MLGFELEQLDLHGIRAYGYNCTHRTVGQGIGMSTEARFISKSTIDAFRVLDDIEKLNLEWRGNTIVINMTTDK